MRRSQDTPVRVPLADVGRLERLVVLQPARGHNAADGGDEGVGDDDDVAALDHRVPVSRERLTSDGGLSAQEGVELRILVECQADGSGGAAKGENEAEVAGLRLEWCHCAELEDVVLNSEWCSQCSANPIDEWSME